MKRHTSYVKMVAGTVFLVCMTLPLILNATSDSSQYVNPVVTLLILTTFFKLCFFSETALGSPKQYGVDGFYGIFSLMTLALGLLAVNAITTIPAVASEAKKRFETFKPNAFGSLLVLGAGAIVFGFLDNYGMKLGTDALEDGVFWKAGVNAIGKDPDSPTRDYTAGLNAFNDFFTTENPDIVNLFKSKTKFQETDEIIARYDAIKSSGSMLGNTFSDFVGALLGAGVSGIFSYLTAIDADVENASLITRMLQNPVSKVVLEACFIAMGCLIPVGLHFRSAAKDLGQKRTGKWLPGVNNFVFLCIMVSIIVGLVLMQFAVSKESNIFTSTADDDIPADDGPLSDDEDGESYEHVAVAFAGVAVMTVLMMSLYHSFKKASA